MQRRHAKMILDFFSLAGKTALVTGSSRGLGAGIARALAEAGAQVALHGSRSVPQSTLDAISSIGPRTIAVTGDVSKPETCTRLVDEVVAAFGKIDILINNAAIVGPNASTWEYPPEAFRDVVNVGLVGTFYCCRAVVPHMIAANYGRIVNISSVAGKEGNPKAPAYSSMKAAVIGLTKSLGKELAGYDIAVNCVTPAVAKTTLAMSQAPDFLAMIVSKIPRGRMLELEEAAAMICWLASAENSFTTGAVFDLSGGRATY
jgi:2-dehydro-3-deoxy-L-rhamnonate dehydrogenase (NAD+)